MIRSIVLPAQGQDAFLSRASSHFPNEIQEFLIGRSTRTSIIVERFLPPLDKHVVVSSPQESVVRYAAFRRAKQEALKEGLWVVGHIHTHPYPEGMRGYSATLSKEDVEVFDRMLIAGIHCPVMGVVALATTLPGGIQGDFAFWKRDTPLKLEIVRRPR